MPAAWSEMVAELDGYRCVSPAPASIDLEIANHTRCPVCGRWMRYEGYRLNGSYRAFAVCYGCNEAVEF
jgi:hypothetical protein